MAEHHKKSDISMQDLLKAKKEGRELTEEMIQFYIDGVVKGTIPDYQISALLMAIYFRGCNVKERSLLTKTMARSGKFMDFSDLGKFVVDKHSTGGLGDKTSLFLSPIVACLGVLNPMVTGRGLGHTGGTTDKMETIPGYNCGLSFDDFKKCIREIGCFIGTQTADIAPADKRIYSIRDTSETVDEISLITASILSKKFSEGLNGLTMDVKCGTGAFMQNPDKARELAQSLVNTANEGGVVCESLITRMDYPLGVMVGNTNEVWECLVAMDPKSGYTRLLDDLEYDENVPSMIKFKNRELSNNLDSLMYITIALALNMMRLSGMDGAQAFKRIVEVWKSGEVLEKFKQIVKYHGGNLEEFEKKAAIINEAFNKGGPNIFQYRSTEKCKIKVLDGTKLGFLMVSLGAGRKKTTDILLHEVSMKWYVYPNQVIEKDQLICEIYHPDPQEFIEKDIKNRLDGLIQFTTDLTFHDNLPLVYERVVRQKE